MMNSKLNVLITCGGGFQGLTLVKVLKTFKFDYDLNVFLTDINNENITKYFADYFVESPPVNDQNKYTAFLEKYCNSNEIKYIIPATVIDISILSSLKKYFFENYSIYILVPDKDILDIFLRKDLTYKFLQANSLPALPIYFDFSEDIHFPIILKPTSGQGSKGIIKIQNENEIKKFQKETSLHDYIIQPLIKNFDEYSFDFSVSPKGDISNFIIRKRNFVTLGFACVMEYISEPNEKLLSIADSLKEIFSNQNFTGFFNIQIIHNKDDDNYYISDINPRIGTSSVFSKFIYSNIVSTLFNFSSNENDLYKYSNKFNYKVVRYLDEKILPHQKLSIKNIVIDLDNTIIDTLGFTVERCKRLYYQLNPQIPYQLEEFLNFCLTTISNGKISSLIDSISNEFELNKEELLRIYQKILPPVPVYPDALKLIRYLCENNKNLILLTMAENQITQQLKISSIKNFFNKIYIVNEKYSIKTQKNVFKDILVENDLNPDVTISIGDNFYTDIYPAYLSNYKCLFQVQRKNTYIPNIFPKENINNLFYISSISEIIHYIE